MSDYQSVRVIAIDGRTLTVEVEEVHPDMQTIHDMMKLLPIGERMMAGDLLDETDGTSWYPLINAAALLLFSEGRHLQKLDLPENPGPEALVSSVKILEATPLAESSQEGIPSYKAVLEIGLQRDQDVAVFKVGRSFGTVAYIYGDFDDCFY